MIAPFYIVRGTTAPSLTLKLVNPDGTAPDLTGATAALKLENRAHELLVDGAAMTVNAGDHSVTYEWQDGDLPDAGLHYAMVIVTFPDLSTMGFPGDGPVAIMVSRQPGD